MQNRKRKRKKSHRRPNFIPNHQWSERLGAHKQRTSNRILERSDIFRSFKRQAEDILKYIYEHDHSKVRISDIKKEFSGNNKDINQFIRDLIAQNYIIKDENHVLLTPSGEDIAQLIFNIHNEIEEFIKGKNLRCNAHKMAHILEHNLTEEQMQGMIRASEFKDKGISLPIFKLPSGTIVDVMLNNCKVWTKLVSIGLFPGQKIHILNRTGSNYLIEVKNSKFAIDRNLAEGIFLIP
jgi:Mn-dependent DtxR family transcriptional regulator/Fe2+ transport system protein FeoA